MLYRVYKLHFSTPVRFGYNAGNDTQIAFCADTLFSALYLSLMKDGRHEELLKLVNENALRLSDAMPFDSENLYISRPAGIYADNSDESFDPSVRKALKRIQYIPTSKLAAWLGGKVRPEEIRTEFGRKFDRTRVNLQETDPLPYQVDGFIFDDDCGLYFIAAGKDEKSAKFLDDAVQLLAASGIGGKVSSGWGHFDLEMGELQDTVLLKGLQATGEPCQMLISTAFPGEEEAEPVMRNAQYVLKRRGGFTAELNEKPAKKRTTWHFAAGSTFTTRFDGVMMDVATVSSHPVWRYAKALMIGVNLK
ncbi:MAG: type III-A CRISPR-associated RAMP protein Csm4 [Clostridia bacterium]|nr:type III-A CRISPR-associated RAMP protein Csm4 [Clostridia bacterium]